MSIRIQKGNIALITKAENTIIMKKQSAVASKYAPKVDTTPSFRAIIPSKISVVMAKLKIRMPPRNEWVKKKCKNKNAATILNAVIVQGMKKCFLLESLFTITQPTGVYLFVS